MPKLDENGFEIAQDENGFELVHDEQPQLDNPENRSFFSNFHPLEDLASAGSGLLDFGKGLAGMGSQLMLRGPMGMAADAGNQLATQMGINSALQAANDPRAQSTGRILATQGLGSVSPLPIEPLLDVAKGVGYGSHLTNTPVSPEAAARGIGSLAGASALFLGPMAHGPELPPITNMDRLLPQSTESRTFYAPDAGPAKEVRDFYNWQNPETGLSFNDVPSKVTRDIPMTKVVGPKGKSVFEFNPEDQTFTHKTTGQVYNTKGEIIKNPIEDFVKQVVPPSTDIFEAGKKAFPADNLPEIPVDLDQLQMHLDEGKPLPQPKTKRLNPEKESRVVRQLMQETGATVEEATAMRELQRIYPHESTRRLREFVQDNLGGFEQTLRDVTAREELEHPQFAMTPSGKLQIGVNVKRAADELTSGYNYDLSGIMVREGLQNALDAIKDSPNSGNVKIRIADDSTTGKALEISDDGKGMSRDEIFTVFSDLHSTGKANQAGASGGKGVGKATYMLGGKYFKARTVKEIKGIKYETTLEGSPEDLMGGNVEVVTKKVSPNTPTGTWFRTDFKEGTETFWSRAMLNKILQHSRDIRGNITDELYGLTDQFKSFKDDKLVEQATLDKGNSDVGIYIPENAGTRDGRSIDVHYLNNGMFQYTKSHYIPGDEVKGIPKEILVDIKPKVEEGSTDYPFPVQRESIKDSLQKEIENIINEKIVEKRKNQGKNELIAQWDKMVPLTRGNSGRESVIYDPGNRLTPDELKIFSKAPIVHELTQHVDSIIDDILTSTARQNWVNRVSRTGITLDEKLAGIHLPDPATKGLPLSEARSGILINPFSLMEHASPADAALDMVVTALHEVAHVGPEDRGRFTELNTKDLNDPRVGRYLQTYLKETLTQGNAADRGHNVEFLHRLGEVYGTYGTREALDAATRIESAISESGRYRPEIQRLLQLYSERKRRANVTEDILSGTGTKSTVRGRGRRDFSRTNQTDGDRTFGGTAVVDKKKAALMEAFNFPRAIQASIDLSAPLRQGRAFAHKKQYWQAFDDMFKAAGSENAFRAIQDGIQEHPLYRFATDHGLKFTDLTDMTHREEAIMSTWAETGGSVPYISKAYRETVGRGVRASNRAYTAFLNKLRMDVYADLAQKNNLTANTPLARAMADFVNTATGRGSLGRFEKNATELNTLLYAPRNTMSQIKMLNIFNPNHYIYQEKPVRMEALKSLASMAGTTGIILSLAKMGGAKVTLDPTNADFGKVHIGKTRLDFNGGYGQYIVAFSRMVQSANAAMNHKQGSYRSSKTGQKVTTNVVNELGRVGRNKEHPVISFVHSFLTGRTPTGMKFQAAPQTIQLFTPMLMGDLAELAKKQPDLVPIAAPFMVFGAGSQTY